MCLNSFHDKVSHSKLQHSITVTAIRWMLGFLSCGSTFNWIKGMSEVLVCVKTECKKNEFRGGTITMSVERQVDMYRHESILYCAN